MQHRQLAGVNLLLRLVVGCRAEPAAGLQCAACGDALTGCRRGRRAAVAWRFEHGQTDYCTSVAAASGTDLAARPDSEEPAQTTKRVAVTFICESIRLLGGKLMRKQHAALVCVLC